MPSCVQNQGRPAFLEFPFVAKFVLGGKCLASSCADPKGPLAT